MACKCFSQIVLCYRAEGNDTAAGRGVVRVYCRFLIQILPAAVVAPLYFRNQIGFGVINQSSSAFNHILSDVSLVVYQACPCTCSCRYSHVN